MYISKLLHLYFGKRALPYWCILVFDCAIIVCAGMVAFYLAHNGLYVAGRFWQMIGIMILYLLPYCVGFHMFHTYSGLLRYSSFSDLQKVVMAMGTGTSIAFLLNWIWLDNIKITHPNYFGLIFIFVVSTMFMWMIRVIAKSIYESVFNNSKKENVFIYGAKSGAVSIAKGIVARAEGKYIVRGFVCDTPDMANKRLMGHKVYLEDKSLATTMISKGIKTLMVSPLESENFRANDALVNDLIESGIKIMMFPPVQEWDGKSEVYSEQLKEVDIEDLLPREKITVDMDAIGKELDGKTILITGAAGSIGSEMVRQIAKYNIKEMILIDQAETPMHDIRLLMSRSFPNIKSHTIVTSIANETRMDIVFKDYQPDFVFHAAAYKHVPMMEDNPSEAVHNNIYGTKVIADLSVKYGVKKFVMISTDKAVNPTNVMGCSKRICEIYVQSLNKEIANGTIKGNTQFVTTRFGNVLGSNGSVIPLFKEQIKNGGPVTVTHPEIIRFFMLIPEACKLVLEAGTMGSGGEIFVFDMGKPVKIADLAKRMIALSHAKGVEIKYTGLRDGEKLYEEVLNNEEKTKPTYHSKIKIAAVREYDFNMVETEISKLIDLSYTYDDMNIVRQMKEIVPEFKSQHSKYEVLD